MNPLEDIIAEEIRQKGPITFERFMELALHDPRHGYYFSHDDPTGREGDFYTSSHLHPVFGSLIGRQMEEMWIAMERPEQFKIVEMGAGAGYVCRDMLDCLKDSDLYGALQYLIVERNERQASRQRELLAGHAERLKWASSPGQAGPFSGCVFTNELMDSFPVHVVEMQDDLREIYVTMNAGRFEEVPGPLSDPEIGEYMRTFAGSIDRGYRTEVNLRMRDWIGEVSELLEAGFIFTVDYGYPAADYFSDDRNRGTLMCYRRHSVSEDPYINVGEQDITAHVNFSALARWGEECGFKNVGFTSQGAFLVSLGVDEEIARLAESSADYLFELARIKKLVLPAGMGETHQVLIQYKGPGNPALRGFSVRNRVRGLL